MKHAITLRLRIPAIAMYGLLFGFSANTSPAWMPEPGTPDFLATVNGRYASMPGHAPPGASFVPVEGYSHAPELGIFYDVHYPWVHTDAYGWAYIAESDPMLVYLLDSESFRFSHAGMHARLMKPGYYVFSAVELSVVSVEGEIRAFWSQLVYDHNEEKWRTIILGSIVHDAAFYASPGDFHFNF